MDSKHRWGIFVTNIGRQVAPIDADEHLVVGHVLDIDCPCHPWWDRTGEPEILVHEAIQ